MLSNSEDECSHIKEQCDNLEKEQAILLEKNNQAIQDCKEISIKMSESESKFQEDLDRINKERKLLETKLQESEKESTRLVAQIEEIQAERDFSNKQLSAMRGGFAFCLFRFTG